MSRPVQNAAQEAPSLRKVEPLAALLLSAGLLPGLGQLLTGRLLKGALMVGAVTLWLPIALIKLGRDLSLVLPSLLEKSGGSVSLVELQAALSPLAGGIIWLFAPLVTVWFWSLFDSIIYLRQSRQQR